MADEFPFLILISPYQIWELVFTDTMLQEVIEQTLSYGIQRQQQQILFASNKT